MTSVKIIDFQNYNQDLHNFIDQNKDKIISVSFTPKLIKDDKIRSVKPTELPKLLEIYNNYIQFTANDPDVYGKIIGKYKINIKNIEVNIDYSMLDTNSYDSAFEHLIYPDDDESYPIKNWYMSTPSPILVYIKKSSKPASIPKDSKKSKESDKILNEKTGRMVLKSGKIGQEIMKLKNLKL
jgi:hypothetical protein